MLMIQRLSILALSALLGALALPAFAQKAGGDTTTVTKQTSPGKGTVVHERQIIATVEEVDAAKGQVTLKGPKGNVVALTVGPEVRNLAQVKVGDQVRVRYAEALTLTLKKDGKELPSSKEDSAAARTPQGARPGGAVAEQVTVIADVIAINMKTQEVTLRGPKQTVDLYIEDPKQLKLIKVGDQVEAVYTQAVALTVEPVAAKK
jgi:Cu/Ag efflux protein CusF